MFSNTATTSELSATLSEGLNGELIQYLSISIHIWATFRNTATSATTSESPTTGESSGSKSKCSVYKTNHSISTTAVLSSEPPTTVKESSDGECILFLWNFPSDYKSESTLHL